MRFSVEAPSPADSAFYNNEPAWPCHRQHDECAPRPGGPCSQLECTCETTGRCLACVPNRVTGIGRLR
jgi:hypothetical protein